MFNNKTRNQHFIAQVEQKLNAIDPAIERKKRKIFKFELHDREPTSFSITNPTGVKIENNLSFDDLYTFDIFSDQSRNNFENFFKLHEDNIEEYTNKILYELENNKTVKVEDLKKLVFSKFMNIVRNPYCIEKTLNSFGDISSYRPTASNLNLEFMKIKKDSIHVSQKLLAEFNITEDMYISWLKLIFMFFSVHFNGHYLGEHMVEEFFNIKKNRMYIYVFQYESEICLLSDRSYVDLDEAVPQNHIAMSFNLNKNSFLSIHFFENNLDNLKAFSPKLAPILESYSKTYDLKNILKPRIDVIISKNNYEALKNYNFNVIYQCQKHFYAALQKFIY